MSNANTMNRSGADEIGGLFLRARDIVFVVTCMTLMHLYCSRLSTGATARAVNEKLRI